MITPSIISQLDIEKIQSARISKRKASYIKNLSALVYMGELILEELPSLSDEEVRKKFTSVKGIGDWTAKMFLIFVLGRSDILPYEDAALIQGFRWLYGIEHPSVDDVKYIATK